jgi:heterodisulfide reductase subunit B
MEIAKAAIYPGCSLEGTSQAFAKSLYRIFDKLNISIPELEGWTCCGSTSAHAVNSDLSLGLSLRNLALAESRGIEELLIPCAACYHNLANTNYDLIHEPELLNKMNKLTELNYTGGVRIRNILDFLYNCIGIETIKDQIINPFDDLTTVCYYGCLNTRIPRMETFDNVEYPMAMDNLLNNLGINTADWAYKTECCGSGLFITKDDIYQEIVSKIINDAVKRKADCIIVSCPMCHNNLDTKQEEIVNNYGIEKTIPILFISQIIGLMIGCTPKEMGINQSFIQGSFYE